MRKILLILSIVLLYGTTNAISQQIGEATNNNEQQTNSGGIQSEVSSIDNTKVINSAFEKEHVQNKIPMPYQEIREADIFWAKKIWRIIDVREKINHIFYYPFEKTEGRYNLINLLLYGIEKEGLVVYEADNDINGDMITPIAIEDIYKAFGAVSEVQQVRDVETGELREVTTEGEIASEEVKEYIVKEQWYFDKQRSVFEVRIIAICPVREYYREEDEEQTNAQKRRLFWVYFPAVRPLLAKNEIFNDKNDAQSISYDDLFLKRYFSSYIIKESNPFDRFVQSYKLGTDALLEADQIKKSILNYEQDLWEY